MYAIVNIAGQQLKVTENKPVYVHRLQAKEGDSITFDQVLMVGGNGSIKVGSPLLSGASVTAKVISHLKGDKVLVFKKKRRKGYQKMNGHRQYLTKVQVDKISV
jgi:large subunit ribosomal protein L21